MQLNTMASAVALVAGLMMASPTAMAAPDQPLLATCWGAGSQNSGQSFVVDETGPLTALDLWVSHYPVGSELLLSIYEGEGYGGAMLHSQLLVPQYETGSNPPMTRVTMTTPVQVTAGSSYTFSITQVTPGSAGGFCGILQDVYPDGTSYFNGSAYGAADAAFRVHVGEPLKLEVSYLAAGSEALLTMTGGTPNGLNVVLGGPATTTSCPGGGPVCTNIAVPALALAVMEANGRGDSWAIVKVPTGVYPGAPFYLQGVTLENRQAPLDAVTDVVTRYYTSP